jgi:hypothetical protein
MSTGKIKMQSFNLINKVRQALLLKLANDKKFSDEVTKLRQQYMRSKLLAKNTANNLLKNTEKIERLISKYKLSEPYFVPLMQIIILNNDKLENLDLYFKKHRYKTIKNEFGNETIFIPIYPETTMADLRAILPKIKEEYKNNFGKNIPKRNKKISKRNILILQLKELGYNNTQIQQEINSLFFQGKVENTVAIYEIPTIINKLKKQK